MATSEQLNEALARPARFWAKVEKSPGCWLWTGARAPTGYGVLNVGGTPFYAHRFSCALAGVTLKRGLTIDHLCRNRGCVNPAHLEQVTAQENILRGTSPSAAYAEQLACSRGHEFAGANLRINPDGERVCRACHRARNKAATQRKQRRTDARL